MWNVTRFQSQPVLLDFSSSGQAAFRATEIRADGVSLVNALELVDVQPAAMQVHVCAECGTPHCASGGWVALRRIGQAVVWTPAWEKMAAGAWEQNEYGPPPFLGTRGAPVFGPGAWKDLRSLAPELPDVAALPALTSREAVRLAQLAAPGRVLGVHPEQPRLDRDSVVAVAEGEVTARVAEVNALLEDWFSSPGPVELASPRPPVTPVEFFLDLPGTPAWAALGAADSGACLLFGGGPVLLRATD